MKININYFLYNFIVLQIIVIFFIPKFGLTYYFFGFESPLKPEDLIWLISIPFAYFFFPRKINAVQLSLIFFLSCIGLSIFIHYTNIYLLIRVIFYSIPLILIGYKLDSKQLNSIIRIIKAFLIFLVIYGLVIRFIPLPYFHSSFFYFGTSDRFSGNFGNGAELSLAILLIVFILDYTKNLKNFYLIISTIIILLTGTRLISIIILLFGVYKIFKSNKLFFKYLVISLIFISSIYYGNIIIDFFNENERFSTINFSLINDFKNVFFDFSNPINYKVLENEIGYCFNWADSLSGDQSFAMRLSKANFVINSVIIGSYPMGFGFGKCIGGAADNLYIRLLNDGGIFLFFAFIIMISVFYIKLKNIRKYIIVFILISFFYDTLYFSRVSPLFFLLIYLSINIKNHSKKIKEF